MSTNNIPYLKHHDGTQIQAIGLGTYSVSGDRISDIRILSAGEDPPDNLRFTLLVIRGRL